MHGIGKLQALSSKKIIKLRCKCQVPQNTVSLNI